MTPEEIELLSELTIIIPTYNRPLELEKSIEYWRDLPVTVHILDGSERSWFLEGCQPDTNSIFYHSFKPTDESPWENWGRRLKFGTHLTTTRFTALCSDDDVYTTSGLTQALAMLNSESLDAVAGKAGEYRIEGSCIKWVNKYPKLKDEFVKRSPNIRERLMFRGGTQAFYGVFLSEKLRIIHDIGNSYKFPVPVWHEELISTLTRVFCRIKFVEELFWLKNSKNFPMARPIKFAQLFWDNSFVEYKKKFIDGMSQALQVAEPKMTKGERDALIRSYHSLFTKPKKLRKIEVKLKAQILKMIGKFPKFIRIIVFKSLSSGLKKRIGNSNFEVNFNPIVLLSEQELMNDSLRKWESILMMPREELRLKANI